MNFVSYSQNFEDVMLWRALKHVTHGFYIDVGAAWPDEDSVTKAFYQRGWHGINIEPNPNLFVKLVNRRPEDTNLQVAIGQEEGRISMNFVAGTGLSTIDSIFAAQHEEQGWKVEQGEVVLTTLKSVCAEHVPAGQSIHFLKIDVEGLEESVIKGQDWQRYRPWIVLVESTLPMSQVESFEGWEPVLLSADYIFAYADGLNRFYVAKEHQDLLVALRYPPNVFDSFTMITSSQAAHARAELAEYKEQEACKRAELAEHKKQEACERANLAEAGQRQAIERADKLLCQIQAIHNSRSWRWTASLRWFMNQSRRFRNEGFFLSFKTLIRKTSRKVDHATRYTPKLRRALISLSKSLGFYQWMKRASSFVPSSHFEIDTIHNFYGTFDKAKLSSRSSDALKALTHAIDAAQKDSTR